MTRSRGRARPPCALPVLFNVTLPEHLSPPIPCDSVPVGAQFRPRQQCETPATTGQALIEAIIAGACAPPNKIGWLADRIRAVKDHYGRNRVSCRTALAGWHSLKCWIRLPAGCERVRVNTCGWSTGRISTWR